MGIQLTTTQITSLAPDSSSASAGKKLSSPNKWKLLGQKDDILWGLCQGSGSSAYQIKIELSSVTAQCTCPSRKLPCKHSLGLLLLAATTPASIVEAEPPDWVEAWLSKRAASAKRKETIETKAESSTPKAPSAAQKKNAEKRLALVTQGVDQLNLWMNDLIRNGLGTLDSKPHSFWEKQAAQMVDAQAPGLANRVRQLATIPSSHQNWTQDLLNQLGKIALLTEAFQNLDQLDPSLQDDVRTLIGWTLKEEEVVARGEHLSDTWLIMGQISIELDKGRALRTWLFAENARRAAVVEQFAAKGSTFSENYLIGSQQEAELVFWPSASPQRALIAKRSTTSLQPIQKSPSGHPSIEAFLSEVAEVLARQPWRDRFFCILSNVHICYDNTNWYIRDSTGHVLPLKYPHIDHWNLLACSGGHPVDLVGEWSEETLQVLGLFADGRYYHDVEG